MTLLGGQMPSQFTILSIEELKEFFRTQKDLHDAYCYVNSSLRRAWMLNHERTIINATVYDIEFINMRGGVWIAKLTTPPNLSFKQTANNAAA